MYSGGKTKYYWTGKITTKGGAVYEFGAEDIVKGSGYISSQCCGSTEIELGTVYSVEMGITLLADIDRYTLEDAAVELFYHLQISDGTYELNGSFEFTGLSIGFYRVNEDVMPAGYIKTGDDPVFEVRQKVGAPK